MFRRSSTYKTFGQMVGQTDKVYKLVPIYTQNFVCGGIKIAF